MNEKYRFSIITAALNAENSIEKTLGSIKEQSFISYEVILVDGKSQDFTVQKAQKLKIPNLTIISEKDSGIYDAMNKGVKKSSGEYIYFLNAADYLYDRQLLEKIDCVIEELGQPELYYGDVVGYKGENTKYLRQPEIDNKQFFLRKTICHQAIFFKKDLFNTCGYFDTNYKIASDFAWLAKAYINHNKIFTYRSIPICYYCLSGLSTRERYYLERSKIIREYFSVREIIGKIYLRWIYKRMKRLFGRGKKKEDTLI